MLLQSIPGPVWKEWVEWVKIRGPIGPARQDHYVAFLAMQIARTSPHLKEVNFIDFLSPWLRPDEVDSPLAFVRPWVDTRGTDED